MWEKWKKKGMRDASGERKRDAREVSEMRDIRRMEEMCFHLSLSSLQSDHDAMQSMMDRAEKLIEENMRLSHLTGGAMTQGAILNRKGLSWGEWREQLVIEAMRSPAAAMSNLMEEIEYLLDRNCRLLQRIAPPPTRDLRPQHM